MITIILLIIIILSPYIAEIGGYNIKLSYLLCGLFIYTVGLFYIIKIRNFFNKEIMFITVFFIYNITIFLINSQYITIYSIANIALLIFNFSLFIVAYLYILKEPIHNYCTFVDRFLLTLLILGIVTSIIAFIEYVDPTLVHSLYLPRENGFERWGSRGGLIEYRIGSTLGSPNLYGAFLGIVLPLALHFILDQKLFARKMLGIACLVLGMASLALTYSRAGLLGTITGIFFYLWLTKRKSIIIAVVITIGSLVYYFYDDLNFIFMVGRTGNVLDDRFDIWLNSLSILPQNLIGLLFGYGPMNEHFLSYSPFKAAHNIFLSSLNFFGIIGLLMLITIIISISRTIIILSKNYNKSSIGMPYGLWEFQLSIFLGIIAESFVDDVFWYNSQFMTIYFVFLAIIISCHQKTLVYFVKIVRPTFSNKMRRQKIESFW